jgi:cytochrome b subunit of formate dehydrogenase
MTTITSPRDETRVWTMRFAPIDRIMHALLFTSFLGLSLSGLPLLFAEQKWALIMSKMLGGYAVTGALHRFFAFIMVTTFIAHLVRVSHRAFRKGGRRILWGPDSLVPQPKDLIQMLQHVRWFVGRGPRPRFDRYTYWEKFDYWAVFWGMGIIGFSGFMLLIPGIFSRFLPGWAFNVAHLVHGEEALLAMVFIFTIHFFNGNLRPEKFPMDDVMFTGRVTLDEIREERPAEYERILRDHRLEKIEVDPPSPPLRRFARIVGGLAITAGLVMVFLTVYALVF